MPQDAKTGHSQIVPVQSSRSNLRILREDGNRPGSAKSVMSEASLLSEASTEAKYSSTLVSTNGFKRGDTRNANALQKTDPFVSKKLLLSAVHRAAVDERNQPANPAPSVSKLTAKTQQRPGTITSMRGATANSTRTAAIRSPASVPRSVGTASGASASQSKPLSLSLAKSRTQPTTKTVGML